MVRILVWAAFLVVNSIPKWALPTLGLIISSLATYFAGITSANPMLAAVISLAAIGLREVFDRYFTQGVLVRLNFSGRWTRSDGGNVVRA